MSPSVPDGAPGAAPVGAPAPEGLRRLPAHAMAVALDLGDRDTLAATARTSGSRPDGPATAGALGRVAA
ncbi:hypothetical protein ACFV4Q_41035 [Streptomyces nojiriensis]|uniref:hypothetical protein n=1 Tax=Streptomyces nojiriensis TaxID=66374 RepID=UPI00364F61F3